MQGQFTHAHAEYPMDVAPLRRFMDTATEPASSQEEVIRIAQHILEDAVTPKFASMIMADIGTGILDLFKPGHTYTEEDIRALIGEAIFNLVTEASRFQSIAKTI